jgi:hypothetical protein
MENTTNTTEKHMNNHATQLDNNKETKMKHTHIPPQSLTIIPHNLERLPKLLQADQKLAESGITVTWELLRLIEPRFEVLLTYRDSALSYPRSDDSAQWWISFYELVGYGRPDLHPILCTQQAYDVAYESLVASQPASAVNITSMGERDDIPF